MGQDRFEVCCAAWPPFSYGKTLIIIIIIIIIVVIIIIIIISAFGRYCSMGRLQKLSRHPNPGPASVVVPKRRQVFLWRLDFLFCCLFQVTVWRVTQVIGFRGCVYSISSVFGRIQLLLVVTWSVSEVLCCLVRLYS